MDPDVQVPVLKGEGVPCGIREAVRMAENSNLRRSWMIVPAHDPAQVMRCQEFKPDVVVLDLEYSVPPKMKESARAGLRITMSLPA